MARLDRVSLVHMLGTHRGWITWHAFLRNILFPLYSDWKRSSNLKSIPNPPIDQMLNQFSEAPFRMSLGKSIALIRE